MSRKLLAFLLSELNTIRVKCPTCRVVTEMPVEKLASIDKNCKQCNSPLGFPEQTKPETDLVHGQRQTISSLAVMADAIKKIKSAIENNTHPIAEVEFVIPDESE